MGNQQSAKDDINQYLNGYPDDPIDPEDKDDNFKFYSNQIVSKPNGDLIEDIHKNWKGDYDKLEIHHGYIQWLFPIRENGMNYEAQKLYPHEIKKIKSDSTIVERLCQSYQLMLDFYGMQLEDPTTGKIARNPNNWKQRYANLNRSGHNYLRITRILKCLGELGLEHYQAPLVEHCLKEIFELNQLQNTKRSAINYWTPVIKNEKERNRLIEYSNNPPGNDVQNIGEKERNRIIEFLKNNNDEADGDDSDDNWDEANTKDAQAASTTTNKDTPATKTITTTTTVPSENCTTTTTDPATDPATDTRIQKNDKFRKIK